MWGSSQVYLVILAAFTCNPACQNNGKCTSTNTCTCTAGFSGPTCAIESVGLCNVTSTQAPVFSLTFGSGSDQYSKAIPSGFNFSTSYQQEFAPVTNDGQFSFINSVHDDFSGAWHTGALDHTPNDNGGYMFLVNANMTAGQFFNGTINKLVVGQRYEFSVYLANLLTIVGIEPNVLFQVRTPMPDNTLVAQVTSGDIPATQNMTWVKYGISFTAPSSALTLLMISNAPGGVGNDMAIDDIALNICLDGSSGTSASENSQASTKADTILPLAIKAPSTPDTTKAPSAAVTTKTPSAAVTTKAPSAAVTTKAPSAAVTAKAPSAAVTAKAPSAAVTTKAPSAAVTTKAPSAAVTTKAPSAAVTTKAATKADALLPLATKAPTAPDTTKAPSAAVTTKAPSAAVTTKAPSAAVTTKAPSAAVTTKAPSAAVTTKAATKADAILPLATKAPTAPDTTKAPSAAVTTKAPSAAVTTKAPSAAVTTKAPSAAVTTKAPSAAVTTKAPSAAVTIKAPSAAVTTKAATKADAILPLATKAPTAPDTTKAPSAAVTTKAPSAAVTTKAPSAAVTTKAATKADAILPLATKAPTAPDTTKAPSAAVTTKAPSAAVTTKAPSAAVTTKAPSAAVTTKAPSAAVTTKAATKADAILPLATKAPTAPDTAKAPSAAVTTKAPTAPDTTKAPSAAVTTKAATKADAILPLATKAPTASDTTKAPTARDTTKAPSAADTTKAATKTDAILPLATKAPTAPDTTKAPSAAVTTKAPSAAKTTKAGKIVDTILSLGTKTAEPATQDGLVVVQSLPKNASSDKDTLASTKKQKPSGDNAVVSVKNTVSKTVPDDKTYKKTVSIKKTKKTKGQFQGQQVKKQPSGRNFLFGVTDRESNTVRDITIDKLPYDFENLNLDSQYFTGLLAQLLQGRYVQRSKSPKSEPGCGPQDVYVNYVYEYDIHNQVLNASLQDPNSVVVQNLQSFIADSAAEEIYKRNLVSYVTDDVRLIKIIDVSKEYDNRATLRFYVSINVSKNLIPVIRRVLELVFEKLQKECFATSNEKIDWGNMVLIPISK